MISLFLRRIYFFNILCFVYGRHAAAVTIDDFFPFGANNGDSQLPYGDDVTAEVQFMPNFLFYGQSYTFFGVSEYYTNKITRAYVV